MLALICIAVLLPFPCVFRVVELHDTKGTKGSPVQADGLREFEPYEVRF